MIVVDTNVVTYELIPSSYPAESTLADAVFLCDPEWCAPAFWRSEFCNVLVTHVRARGMAAADAAACWEQAQSLLAWRDHALDGPAVIELAVRSGCSAYDCEFVVLARTLGISLVTADKRILKTFPDIAVSLSDFAKGRR